MPTNTSHKRYKQLLERKRVARRRQLVYRVAAGLLLLVVAGLLTLAVAGIRSCAAHRNGGHSLARGHTPQTPKVDPALSKINLVFAHDFHPGPQFVALDSQRVYIGAVTPAKDKTPAATQLAAFNLGGSDALWQQPAQRSLEQFFVLGGNVVGVPASGAMVRYEGLTGKPMADIEADVAETADIQIDGQSIIAGNTVAGSSGKPSSWLAAYDPRSGERLWRIVPKLTGLSGTSDACCGGAPKLELSCWPGVCAYRMHNVLGLLTTKRGRLLRPEYNASGHILYVQLDRYARTADLHSALAYIISGDPSDTTLYRLIRIPLDSDFKPKRLLEFHSSSSQFLLLAEGGKVLLSYADSAGKAKLACFRKDGTAAALTLDADAGVTDMSDVPGSGDFLVATCSAFKDSEPVGRARLLRIRLGATPESSQVAGYGKPVLWLVPFKRDCLALVRGGGLFSGGGQIVRYSADSGKLRLLRRAKYDLLDPQTSVDQTALMVSSYPESYAMDKGGPLQVLVFK